MANGDSVFVGLCGGYGPLAQALPIVNELKKSNLQIICHNYRAAREMVKQMDFTFFGLPEDLGKPEKINPNGPEWWNEDYFWSKYGYLDYNYTKLLIEFFTEALVKFNPKIVIVAHLPAIAVAAKRLKLPLVCLTQACMHRNGRGGRITWWKDLPENLDRTSPVLNRILIEMGMEPVKQMEDLNEGDLTIIPSIPELDPIDNGNVFYTGPMFWQGPEELATTHYPVIRKNQHLIFVYTGHLYNSTGRATGIVLLKTIIEAFNNTEFDLIISTGSGQKIPPEIAPAGNITIVDWVPVNQLLPQCDLFIHHGGHGSCLLGIGHGVPAIVVPTMDEREYNARQLSDLGTGIYIMPDVITPQMLLMEARRVVAQKTFKEETVSLSKEIQKRNYNGAVKAAAMIMGLIKR